MQQRRARGDGSYEEDEHKHMGLDAASALAVSAISLLSS